MTEVTSEDFAAARQQGDLAALALLAAGITRKTPKNPATDKAPPKPGYHIPRKGAWPCGTAASGPTPAPCTDCQNGAL